LAAQGLAAAKRTASDYGLTVKTGIKAARKIADAFKAAKRRYQKGPALAKARPAWQRVIGGAVSRGLLTRK
jgi:hypothetical protein